MYASIVTYACVACGWCSSSIRSERVPRRVHGSRCVGRRVAGHAEDVLAGRLQVLARRAQHHRSRPSPGRSCQQGFLGAWLAARSIDWKRRRNMRQVLSCELHPHRHGLLERRRGLHRVPQTHVEIPPASRPYKARPTRSGAVPRRRLDGAEHVRAGRGQC